MEHCGSELDGTNMKILLTILLVSISTVAIGQGTSVRSLNGNATNLTGFDHLGSPSINTDTRQAFDSGNNISISWGSRVLTDSSTAATVDWANRQLTVGGFIGVPFAWGLSNQMGVTLDLFNPSGTPGIYGNYNQSSAWTAFQAVNPLFPIPWNQHFTGSINGGDSSTNIVMRMGWNVTPTGTVIDSTHASLNLLMEGNEDDVGPEHVSTFVVEANYPDGYVFAPLDISIFTHPGDVDYKTASFQSGFNFWTMYHPLLPTTNLVTLQITPGNADFHFNQLGRFIWDTQADHDLLRINGDADLMKWSHGLGEIEVFNETSSNFRIQNAGYLQVEGKLCVGTNANGGAINSSNQVSISTPTQKDVLDVGVNGNTYFGSNAYFIQGSPANVPLGTSVTNGLSFDAGKSVNVIVNGTNYIQSTNGVTIINGPTGKSVLMLSNNMVGIGIPPTQVLQVNTGVDQNFLVQPHQLLGTGVAFSSVNNANSLNEGFETRGAINQMSSIGATPINFSVNGLIIGQFDGGGVGLSVAGNIYGSGTVMASNSVIITNGVLSVPQTLTAAGTTGNQTINKLAGSVRIAAAGTTVTVTDSFVSANSEVFCTIGTADATATLKNVVVSAGQFIITLGAAATAETQIRFFVVNN
jgi:hypothetical protein